MHGPMYIKKIKKLLVSCNINQISDMRYCIFLFSKTSRLPLKPVQPPVLWVPRMVFRGVRPPDREADCWPLSSAEVKDAWIRGTITALPYVCTLHTHGWILRAVVGKSLCIFEHLLVQGGAEPTDTFRIWILLLRDSLSWLAARGTVEERTPFHLVRNSMAVVREMFGTVISRFGDIAWPAPSPELTISDFFLWGFL